MTIIPESALYPITKEFLDSRLQTILAPSSGICFWHSVITAQIDAGLGQWGRPDLAAIHVWRSRFGPVMNFDLHTFEVKRRDNIDDIGAYEALSHTRIAHFAHVVCHLNTDADRQTHKLNRLSQTCQRFGLGLITFADETDTASFEQHFMAGKRHEPHHETIDRYVEAILRGEPAVQQTIKKWLPQLG